MLSKRMIREAVNSRLSLLSEKQREEKSVLLNQQLNTCLQRLSLRKLACFFPMVPEPKIDINYLFNNYELIVPKWCDDQYKFVYLNSLDNLTKGRYNILEPNDTCLVDEQDLISEHTGFLVPGLGFDYKGNRLGHGQGNYDRLLEHTSGICIGICFEDQLFASIPSDNHDQIMSFIVHENDFFPCVGEDAY